MYSHTSRSKIHIDYNTSTSTTRYTVDKRVLSNGKHDFFDSKNISSNTIKNNKSPLNFSKSVTNTLNRSNFY